MTPDLDRELFKWIRILASARTITALAECVVDAATALLGAQGAAFVVRDGEFCQYVEMNAIAPKWWKSQRFPLNACVCGWTILNARPAIVPDVFNDDRVPGRCYLGSEIKSLLAVPIGGKNALGAMPVYWDNPHQPTEGEIAIATSLADAAATMIDNLRLVTSLERAKSEAEQRAAENERLNEHLRQVISELDHRVKNNLAVVMSVSEQTYRSSGGGEAFQQAFRGRLTALSRVHEALAASGWRGSRLHELVASVVVPLAPAGSRLTVSGPDVMLPARAVFSVASTLHELTTNACKHGAWSNDRGVIRIESALDESNTLRLQWSEREGPALVGTPKDGFGSRLIRQLMPHELAGKIDVTFRPEGLTFIANVQLTDQDDDEAWNMVKQTVAPRTAGSSVKA